MGPEKTIDESGLDDLDQHSTLASDMWLSSAGVRPIWIQYEFDKAYKLHEMWVWNSNQLVEAFLGLGAKDVVIEISQDGENWSAIEGTTQFAQAPGNANYTPNTVVDFGSAMAQYVKITINSGWGVMPQSGLSEVRFFYVPVHARAPRPADWTKGGAEVLSLSIRGIPDNDPEPLYIVVTDSAGQSKQIEHPDPDVALAGDWAEWLIPFDELNGLNLATIRQVTLGLGNPDGPVPGGTGLVYIDEIRVGKVIPDTN